MAALSPVGLTPGQAAMVAMIEAAFLSAGYPLPVAAAAVVNAYAESTLNPKAIGDSGRSVGLFQLSIRGAGAGMSVAERQDPATNIRTLLAREKRTLGKVKALADGGAPLADVVAAFSTLVERPGNKPYEELRRKALLLRLFPLGVRNAESVAPRSVPIIAHTPAPSKAPVVLKAMVWISGLATAALLARALWLERRGKAVAKTG
jgi:hypothetical protein